MVSRKPWIKIVLANIALAVLLGGIVYWRAGQQVPAAARPVPTDSEAALDELRSGNGRFVNSARILSTDTAHDDELRHQTAKEQHPFAVILTCSDSRVCPEFIFDQRAGSIFEIRNAGNVVDEDVLASVEYAVEHLHVPLLCVADVMDGATDDLAAEILALASGAGPVVCTGFVERLRRSDPQRIQGVLRLFCRAPWRCTDGVGGLALAASAPGDRAPEELLAMLEHAALTLPVNMLYFRLSLSRMGRHYDRAVMLARFHEAAAAAIRGVKEGILARALVLTMKSPPRRLEGRESYWARFQRAARADSWEAFRCAGLLIRPPRIGLAPGERWLRPLLFLPATLGFAALGCLEAIISGPTALWCLLLFLGVCMWCGGTILLAIPVVMGLLVVFVLGFACPFFLLLFGSFFAETWLPDSSGAEAPPEYDQLRDSLPAPGSWDWHSLFGRKNRYLLAWVLLEDRSEVAWLTLRAPVAVWRDVFKRLVELGRVRITTRTVLSLLGNRARLAVVEQMGPTPAERAPPMPLAPRDSGIAWLRFLESGEPGWALFLGLVLLFPAICGWPLALVHTVAEVHWGGRPDPLLLTCCPARLGCVRTERSDAGQVRKRRSPASRRRPICVLGRSNRPPLLFLGPRPRIHGRSLRMDGVRILPMRRKRMLSVFCLDHFIELDPDLPKAG